MLDTPQYALPKDGVRLNSRRPQKPTIKQRLSALNKLFDRLVAGNIGREVNPASAVRGPKHIVRQGKTPVLSADQTRHFAARAG